MIYLDYSATTPIAPEVLETMNKVSREYIANANSIHALGIKSKELLESATKQIADLFGVMESELTYTSSATESNNMALIGAALACYKKGKHIIVSKLEHPSIYAICDYLKSIGFEISYVNNDKNGLVDFEHLKTLIKEDTTLVSICAVNSEMGIRQPLKMIRQIIKKENENIVFHSDMTQAIGKCEISLKDVDLATISSHKIYGPKGIALLYKSGNIKITPLIYGSGKSNDLKPGTPALELITGFSKALRIAVNEVTKREKYVRLLNDKIVTKLSSYKDILINQTENCIPHILNISLNNIKPETFIHALDHENIYVSTNTACTKGDISNAVIAVYNDEERAKHTIRISLSHMTTLNEVSIFLKEFDKNYTMLNSLVG